MKATKKRKVLQRGTKSKKLIPISKTHNLKSQMRTGKSSQFHRKIKKTSSSSKMKNLSRLSLKTLKELRIMMLPRMGRRVSCKRRTITR